MLDFLVQIFLSAELQHYKYQHYQVLKETIRTSRIAFYLLKKWLFQKPTLTSSAVQIQSLLIRERERPEGSKRCGVARN